MTTALRLKLILWSATMVLAALTVAEMLWNIPDVVLGVALIVFGVLLLVDVVWSAGRQRRMTRMMRTAEARRVAAGGWENMSDEQRSLWFADIQDAFR